MKRQYLLDERDFRKFALLEDLVETELFSRMALLWMVTPDDSTGQGRSRSRDQSRHRLAAFFRRFAVDDATFGDVADYFRSLGPDVCSYDRLYATVGASRYFADVPARYLDNSIIFLDPDIGFEPSGGPKNAHLRWDDIESIWHRSRGDSLLVAFQYGARKSHAQLEALRSTLADRLAVETAALHAGQVRFFLAGSPAIIGAVHDRLPRLGWIA